MTLIDDRADYHAKVLAALAAAAPQAKLFGFPIQQYRYEFEPFFHPYVGELIQQLNQEDISGLLSPDFLAGLVTPTLPATYATTDGYTALSSSSVIPAVDVKFDPKIIEVNPQGGPYAGYNWELTYHIPIAIAVHLSNSQRFAEAQKWFHLVFDPTNADGEYWRAFPFSNQAAPPSLTSLLNLLSMPDAAGGQPKANVVRGYNAILSNPFEPFVVARTRPGAFQWYAVMRYLDNLIAWGDSLFLQDTVETLNEATLCYVLAANLLGQRPQTMPQRGTTSVKSFAQLKQAGLDRMSNAVVELESQFPFNTVTTTAASSGPDQSGALFGIGRSLYFCIPQNDQLLGYWDTVADRLFKIRNSENIQGVYQQLPLFDPPLDPGMLVKAAAAGIDISGIISGANQPLGPLRGLPLVQKALELASEVKAMGSALLSALEKGDAESLALLRQSNDVQLQGLSENVRFLQWKHAEETTNGLLASRASAIERYSYYLRLMGASPNATTAPATLSANRVEITEDNWDDTYQALVGQYELTVAPLSYAPLKLDQGASPSAQAGASGTGQLFLNANEASELNDLLPGASALQLEASVLNTAAGVLNLIPSLDAALEFLGVGASSEVFSGKALSDVIRVGAEVIQMVAAQMRDQAGIAARTAGYQRRADEWTLQANLAAHELTTLGYQILTSLIAEQVARHEHDTAQTQLAQAQATQAFLQTKFTNAAFYGWMQSQLSGLYYQYYRFACDTAQRAELTVKRELMRPELDQTQYVQFNYWDTGHQGLLSGEGLHLDLKRLEMAYHDSNKRELELIRHVSLRQLDPVALLTLRITGTCRIDVREWLFDRDTPGHYMRRIKSVAVSIPSVVGPYTGVAATLTLQSSTVRVASTLANGKYARQGQGDPRFADYFGSTDLIVTSSGANDGGLFETNLHDERFLPFEGAGAVGTWNLTLPSDLRAFDYSTISDVVLHIRYTARTGGDELAAQATAELIKALDTAGHASQALIFCLRYDFPTEWAAFVAGGAAFTVTLDRFVFPYATQSAPKLTIDGLTLYAANGDEVITTTPNVDLTATFSGLSTAAATATLTLQPDQDVLVADQDRLVFLVLQYHFGSA